MLGCSLMETRTCRKNRNTTLRHGDLYWWKPMLLKLHSRWCWSSTPHRRANNALAMRFSVLERMLLLTAHGVPLVREFHPTLTCERFCDLFSVLVGGNHCWNRNGYSLVLVWTLGKVWTLCKVFSVCKCNKFRNWSLCWIFTWQYSAERSGDLFRSFAARDSLKSLFTKRHTYCCWSAPMFTWCKNTSWY
jgi:hypothetical protein